MPEANFNQVQQKQVPCRSCTDFKSWAKQQRKSLSSTKSEITNNNKSSEETARANCPLDKDDLGKATWGLLHTMAATFPEKPSDSDQSNIKTFFSVFSKLYPCDHCAKDFQKELQNDPPAVSSQNDLAQWLCRMHNKVNLKIGKPEFDCSKINERWRDGWKDGSCD